jgi:hypothetical protein
MTFFVGVQVISQLETHSHRVLAFVPHFNVENLVTLRTDKKELKSLNESTE